MKILNVVEKTIPIVAAMRNARVDFSAMTATVVAVVTDQFRDGRRVCGYAFNSFGRYACGGPLRERFIPRLLAAKPVELLDPDNGLMAPARIVAMLLSREKPGAHAERSMAIGTLELALWDIVGKMRGLPLYQVLAQDFSAPGPIDGKSVRCYAGGGFYQATNDLGKLQDEVRRYLDDGYTDIKIKAGGLPLGEDLRRIESVLDLVGGGRHLALDASCAFDRQGALAYAEAISPYDLRWLEEPCDPADFATYHAVSEAYAGTVAGGENVFSLEEAENFLRYGDFKGRIVLQPDPPLAYGICEFHRILQAAARHGVSSENVMPHGGNMMSLHVTAGFGLGSAESYPGLFGAFGGFSDEVTIGAGRATLPTAPGIGFEAQPALYRIFSELSDLARATG